MNKIINFKKLLFFAFILLSILNFSQQNQLKISDLQPKSEDFVFPLISYPSNPVVENKINTFLQVSELEFIPGSATNPSQLAATAKNSYQNYIYFYSWERLASPKNILSLQLEGEATGAYPEGFTTYRNFDLRTGNLINLQDLFLPSSYTKVEKLINGKVRKIITDYIAHLKSSSTQDEETAEQIMMYESCFTENTLAYLKFYIEKDQITFVASRCSNHAMQALDDLGSHQLSFKLKDLEKYWSPFAKNLWSEAQVAIPSASFQNKLFRGKIDSKYPIMLLVQNVEDDGSLSMVYWYEKSKKLIEWSGALKSNHLSATENDFYDEGAREYIPRAKVEATLTDRTIKGTWRDYKTNKILKLELEQL